MKRGYQRLGIWLLCGVLLQGCATIERTELPTEKEPIGIQEQETALPAMPVLNYAVEKHGDDWMLQLEVFKVDRKSVKRVRTYRQTQVIKKTIMSGPLWFGGEALCAMGGGYLLADASKMKPGDVRNDQVVDTEDIQAQKSLGGLLIGGAVAYFVADLIRSREERKDLGEGTETDEAEVEIKRVPLRNATVDFETSGGEVRQIQLNGDGKASVSLKGIPGLEATLDSGSIGVIKARVGDVEKSVVVTSPSKMRDEYAARIQRDCLRTADSLIVEGKFQSAYTKLKACDQVDKRLGVLRLHLRITSKEISEMLYPGERDVNLRVLLLDPASLEGSPMDIIGTVFQKLDSEDYLLNLGGDKIVLIHKAPNSDTPFRFVTGQLLKIRAVVRGDYTYSSTSGGSNTVTRLDVLWADTFR